MTVSMTWPEYLAGCCRIGGRLTRLTFLQADVLCALLLFHPDRPAPVKHLIDVIWADADRGPDDPGNVLTTEVCYLRRRGVEIVCRPQFGYRIPREARGQSRAIRPPSSYAAM